MLYKQHAYIRNTGKHIARQHVYIMFAYGSWMTEINRCYDGISLLFYLLYFLAYSFFFLVGGREVGGGCYVVFFYRFVLPFEMC